MSLQDKTCFWCGEKADHHCYDPDYSYSCDSCCLIESDIACGDTDYSQEAKHKWLDKVRSHLWRLQGIKENDNNCES